MMLKLHFWGSVFMPDNVIKKTKISKDDWEVWRDYCVGIKVYNIFLFCNVFRKNI